MSMNYGKTEDAVGIIWALNMWIVKKKKWQTHSPNCDSRQTHQRKWNF